MNTLNFILTLSVYYFFLFLTSSTPIIMRQSALLTTNGTLAVKMPETIQPRLPALTKSLMLIGFFASIPPARNAVANQPNIWLMMYSIYLSSLKIFLSTKKNRHPPIRLATTVAQNSLSLAVNRNRQSASTGVLHCHLNK